MKSRDVLIRTQQYERYMQAYGTELIRTYNQFNGLELKEIQMYVDPHEGKLRADVVLSNGARIPLLVDVDFDWELSTTDNQHSAPSEKPFEEVVGEALEERRGWENS